MPTIRGPAEVAPGYVMGGMRLARQSLHAQLVGKCIAMSKFQEAGRRTETGSIARLALTFGISGTACKGRKLHVQKHLQLAADPTETSEAPRMERSSRWLGVGNAQIFRHLRSVWGCMPCYWSARRLHGSSDPCFFSFTPFTAMFGLLGIDKQGHP